MDKEIELILSKLKIVSEEQERGLYLCDKEHSKLLLDYITNLQQENERLKLAKDTKSASEIICQNLHDVYKSRVEKAVEYLKKEKSNYMRSCDISNATNREGLIISSAVRTCDDTLNILNGRSDE